jgi:hypothetical protein
VATVASDYQSDLVFDKAFGLGRMVVRGWITADAVEVALFYAGKACGLVAETPKLKRSSLARVAGTFDPAPRPEMSRSPVRWTVTQRSGGNGLGASSS